MSQDLRNIVQEQLTALARQMKGMGDADYPKEALGLITHAEKAILDAVPDDQVGLQRVWPEVEVVEKHAREPFPGIAREMAERARQRWTKHLIETKSWIKALTVDGTGLVWEK